MSKRTYHFSPTDREIIRKLTTAFGGDGHSVYDAKVLIDAGMDVLHAAQFVEKFTSDTSDHKRTIFDHDGKVIPESTGVYGLTVLETIVKDLRLKQARFMGRGFRARYATETIQQWLATQDVDRGGGDNLTDFMGRP